MSPAGSTILFMSTRDGSYEIYRMAVDGRRIIFQSVRDGNFEVYQVDADGRNPVRLTQDPAWDGWASFVRPARRGPGSR